MKTTIFQNASLILIIFFIVESLNAQTCNDPNAHNFGIEGACQTCFDLIQNGDETGIDCGGSNPNCIVCPPPVHLDVEGNINISNAGNLLSARTSGELQNILTIDENDDVVINRGSIIDSFPSNVLIGLGENKRFLVRNSLNNQSIFIIDEATGNINISNAGNFLSARTSGELQNILTLDGSDDVVINRGSIIDGFPSNVLIGLGENKRFLVRNSLNNQSIFIIDEATGNVGIGLTTPSSARLHVNGELRIGTLEEFSDGGARIMQVNSSFLPDTDNERTLGMSNRRWTTVYSTNGTINTSDKRMKSNIKKSGYGLSELLKLNPVKFHWKNQPEMGEKIGLIAQEVKLIIPEVVVDQELVTDEETGLSHMVKTKSMGIYYADLIPVLIKAIQEQQAVIEDLERRLQLVEKK